jgi:chemotaxis protein CheC
MAELSLEQMTDTYADVLKEIGNIGAGNAMTALSQMLNCKIDMQVPQVKLLDLSNVATIVGSEEQLMVGVFLGVEGDISGSIMFLIELKSAKVLLKKIMMGYESGLPMLDEMEASAMQEVSNIITGAYLNSLSSLTNLVIYPTPPSLSIDMAAAILSVPAIQFGMMGDKALMIQTAINADVAINGYFILMPEPESYDKILTSLGIQI